MNKFLAVAVVIVSLIAPGTAVHAQDADRGEDLFERCAACHTLKKGGANKVGPNLWGLFGSTAGRRDTGFGYSRAMRESGIVWTEMSLSAYLERPRGFMPGTRMLFAGMKKADQRRDLIAYLRAATR